MPTPQEMTDQIDDLTCRANAIDEKLAAQKKLVYRLTPADGQMTVRRWLAPPDSVAHDVPRNIWNGAYDPVSMMLSHPNAPTSTAFDDWQYNGADDQMEGFGAIEVLTPIWVQEDNTNTGELGDWRYRECCGSLQVLEQVDVNTPADDRGTLHPVLIQPGIHWFWVGTSDFSANQGVRLKWSDTETGTYENIADYPGRKWSKKPAIECLAIGFCDETPEGYAIELPKLCDPVFVPVAGGGLTEDEVLALIPAPVVVPDQEICTGDFVDVTGRAGWLHTWTPTYTANSGTIIEDYVQVSTAEVSPNCITDATINVDLGNSYFQLRNMFGRAWYDVRLLINGTAVTTWTFAKYHYEDDLGEANLSDDITPLGSVHFARANVPAGATVTVEIRRRHNFVAGNGNTSGRVISGLRAHFNVHYSPVQIVTGRV